MEKTVICVATPLYAPEIGGPATHVALLEQGLPRDTFELRVVAFSSVRWLPKVLRHVVYFFRVLDVSKHADVMYTLDPVSVGLPALCAALLRSKKLVLRVGGDYAWEQGVQRFGVEETLDEFVRHRQRSMRVRMLQAVQSFVARRAVRVVAPSNYLARIIKTWGVETKRIQVIYSQPELSMTNLSRSDARKKLGIHEDEEIVFSAGRLVPWKGFEGLVDAVLHARSKRPVRLYIAGDGPGKDALQSHIKEKGSAQTVSLLGQLSHEDLQVWLTAADMFVLNTAYEGLSHAVLEAFASRTPVITTPVGGNTELVEDGSTGILVEQNNTEALAGAIARVLEDRVMAAELAGRAYESLRRFNTEEAIKHLTALFTSI